MHRPLDFRRVESRAGGGPKLFGTARKQVGIKYGEDGELRKGNAYASMTETTAFSALFKHFREVFHLF